MTVLDTGPRSEHRPRGDALTGVGLARPPIGQPAGWDRAPVPTRLVGMTTDTAVLPPMATTAPASVPRARGWFPCSTW